MPPKRSSSTLSASNLGASSSKARAASLAGKGAAAKGKAAAARTSSTGSASGNARAASPEKTQSSTKEERELADKAQELDVDDPAWDEVWEETRERAGLGKGKLVHASTETRIDLLLRAFDLDPRYGPALGLTRLERWTRAQNLGDEPPAEIRCILETRQGRLQLRDSVLADMGV